jgi:preprotein translocase subunit YajC
MGPLLALLLTFGLMWVLLILPQQRKMRQHQVVVASLEAGDEVVTAGGVYGTIISVDEETLAVEVAPGVVLRVLRSAVSQRIAPADGVDEDGVDDDDVIDDDGDDGYGVDDDGIEDHDIEDEDMDRDNTAGATQVSEKDEL